MMWHPAVLLIYILLHKKRLQAAAGSCSFDTGGDLFQSKNIVYVRIYTIHVLVEFRYLAVYTVLVELLVELPAVTWF